MGEEVTRKRNCNRPNRFATVSDTRRKGEVSRECHHILHSTSSSCQIRAVSPHANHSCAASRQSQLLHSTNFSVPPRTELFLSIPVTTTLFHANQRCVTSRELEMFHLKSTSFIYPMPTELFLPQANQRCFFQTQSKLFHLLPIKLFLPKPNR